MITIADWCIPDWRRSSTSSWHREWFKDVNLSHCNIITYSDCSCNLSHCNIIAIVLYRVIVVTIADECIPNWRRTEVAVALFSNKAIVWNITLQYYCTLQYQCNIIVVAICHVAILLQYYCGSNHNCRWMHSQLAPYRTW